MKNKVSVIVNFHNGEKYLKNCIQSILDQSYYNLEIICWDNFSNDKSKEIVESFTDQRIKYFFNEKKNKLYEARNKAISVTTGSLIAFLDSDDWWEKEYLMSRAKEFENDNYDFFYSNTFFYYEKNKKKKLYKKYFLPSGNIFDLLSKDYFIIISGVIFKKKIFDDYRMFNENFNIIGDFDFIMDIATIYNAHAINLPLINYRVHENNFSRLNSKIFFDEYQLWYDKQEKIGNQNFLKNINYFKKKLSYLKINYLLNNNYKSLKLFLLILFHKNFKEKIKFLVLFFLPQKYFKFVRK